MLLKEFPNIHWIREQSKTNFGNGQALGNVQLPEKGWPSVVLSTQSSETFRSSITAPFSLFMNLAGQTKIHVGGKSVAISEDTFCLVNKGDVYDLEVEKESSAHTFNVHFGDQLLKDTLHTIRNNHSSLMDNPEHDNPVIETFFRSHWKDGAIHHFTAELKDHYRSLERRQLNDQREAEILHDLLIGLINRSEKDLKGLDALSSQKRSTREELMSRLSLAIDYMHAHYGQSLDIDQLSRICALSKFHFIRTFKEVYQCTPHQYLANIRLNKAEELLSQTTYDIREIALLTGFEEPNSLTRSFTKTRNLSPTHYRLRFSNFG